MARSWCSVACWKTASATYRDAVPGLGKIPVLGALFRSDTRKRAKTNLMVFLRPHVVRDPTQDSA